MRNMLMKCAFGLAILSVIVRPAPLQATTLTTTSAIAIFANARKLCDAENGKLWGASLCVTIMVADPNTRRAYTNAAVPDAIRDGKAFRLDLPADATISTAPFTYDRVRLAQLSWPMFGGADTRAVTLMHESFHVIQPRLGFHTYDGEGSITGDEYLDTQLGRVWLRGELHALRAALKVTGEARRRAVSDALVMRRYRDSLFPGTAELERKQDIIEGLAEGTGIDAGLPPSHRLAYALFDISFVEMQPSYARSFPYATGPAYTELLDAVSRRWRREIRQSSDVALATMYAYGLDLKTPTTAQARAIIARYDGSTIVSQETRRARRRVAQDATYRRELVTGSTIELPMKKFAIRFNPRDVQALDPYGTVYHSLTVTAAWGRLEVSGGNAMISKDFRVLLIGATPAPHGGSIRGKGWTLTLGTGSQLVADPTKIGSFLVSTRSPIH